MDQKFLNVKSWPFEEARRIYEKIGGKIPKKGYVLFETGYGPSGLPHIGTFGEVVRTCYVKYAFEQIAPNIPTKLICISDDIDGMRKIPDNVPQKEMLKEHLGKSLTSVPDPFETHESYGHNMNSRLREFLDAFGFNYEFISATEKYKSGAFDKTMLKVVEKYDELMDLMLKNLGEERQETYSPIMPICPETGRVLAEGVVGVNKEKGTVIYIDINGEKKEMSVTGGNCKLQWKIDFGARWMTLDVDYEIFGKDHAPNEKIYRKVCEILGGIPPVNYWYELFLGEDGAKISKSKGNGITVNEWLKYAPEESLALFMYQKPKTAKRLFFDVIPRCVDDYMTFVEKYQQEDLENPAYFINFGNVPNEKFDGINYSLILNLAAVCSAENDGILWKFVERYNSSLKKGKSQLLDKIIKRAIVYYNDFVKPNKKYRKPTEIELPAFKKLIEILEESRGKTAQEIQNKIYQIGMDFGFELKDWFSAIYQVCLGQVEGPRVGTFIAIYGVNEMIDLIKSKL